MKNSFFSVVFRLLIQYLRPHRSAFILTLILSMMSTCLGMIQPYFAKIFIDVVFIRINSHMLVPLLAVFSAVVYIGFVIKTINNYIYTRYSSQILFTMRQDMFYHLHRIPLTYLTKKKIGDLFSRISTDLGDIQTLLTDTIPQFFFNAITCLITIGIMSYLNLEMTILSLTALPFGIYIIHRLRPKLKTLSDNVSVENAEISHLIYESISNTPVVRSFGTEKTELAKLSNRHNRMLGYVLTYRILGAMSNAVSTLFIVVNTIIVFGYGGRLVLSDQITIGTLIAFSIYQGRIFSPLQGLMEVFLSIQKSQTSLTRIQELFDIQRSRIQDGDQIISPDRLTGAIDFKNVCFRYDSTSLILDNISFHIPGRQITAIVGPSGVGKTTICYLLLRLLEPDSGKIYLDGVELSQLKIDWLRKQVVMVSQDIFLFHGTISENIRFSNPYASDAAVIEAAKTACIHDYIISLPNAYETIIGDRGIRLSGGQKQRISIARALLLSPQILILDEATAFLDTEAEDQLKDAVRSLMRNKTVIIISHRSSTIQDAECIITLDQRD